MNRAIEEWKAYRLTSIFMSPGQERACSHAFYAGMISAFWRAAAIAATASDEESGAAEMEKFRQEIDFAATGINLDRSKGTS